MKRGAPKTLKIKRACPGDLTERFAGASSFLGGNGQTREGPAPLPLQIGKQAGAFGRGDAEAVHENDCIFVESGVLDKAVAGGGEVDVERQAFFARK